MRGFGLNLMKSTLFVLAVMASMPIGVASGPGKSNQDAPSVDPGAPTNSGVFSFGVIADNPNISSDEDRFARLIEDVNNQQSDISWVVHLGDYITGQEGKCSRTLPQERLKLFEKFQVPFIFTPGDNDWAECRADGKEEAVARLSRLRKTFFADPHTTIGATPFSVTPQSEQGKHKESVENVLWTRDDVLFATVHIISVKQKDRFPDVTSRRHEAAVAWIEHVFDLAEKLESRGVFLAFHWDVWPLSGTEVALRRACGLKMSNIAGDGVGSCTLVRQGGEFLVDALARRSVQFGRPVVAAVGNSHYFRIDKPLTRSIGAPPSRPAMVENFTRLGVFGSPYVHWVKVRVNPSSREVFSFEPQVISENILSAEDFERAYADRRRLWMKSVSE